MSEALPFVSIIVPVYNAEGMIGECIESLLHQDYPKDRYEMIIVDDHSVDKTAEVIRRYPVRYLLKEMPRGTFRARDAGARCARGSLLAHCDADQVATPGWLRLLVEGLGDCGGVAGPILAFQREGRDGAPARTGTVVEHYAALDAELNPPLPAGPQEGAIVVGTGNVLYRREVHEQLGGFRNDWGNFGGDRDFANRVIHDLGLKIAYAPKAVMYHRPRTTAWQLLRHEIRFGYAAAFLREVNRQIQVDSLLRYTVQFSKANIRAGGALLLTALLFWRHERPLHKGMLIAFGSLMRTAHLVGRLAFAIGWEPPNHW